MGIRSATEQDLSAWIEMRSQLWPDSAAEHPIELKQYFNGSSIDIVEVFVFEIEPGRLVGFVEINVRDFAEGSRSAKVPYIEAWFVSSEYRSKGYGRALMRAAEEWALKSGYQEIASDTELSNEESIRLHKYLGYRETARVVCFLKKLKDV